MLNLYCKFKALWATRDQGVTTIEYALLVAALLAIVVAGIGWLYYAVQNKFAQACDQLNGDSCGG